MDHTVRGCEQTVSSMELLEHPRKYRLNFWQLLMDLGYLVRKPSPKTPGACAKGIFEYLFMDTLNRRVWNNRGVRDALITWLRLSLILCLVAGPERGSSVAPRPTVRKESGAKRPVPQTVYEVISADRPGVGGFVCSPSRHVLPMPQEIRARFPDYRLIVV